MDERYRRLTTAFVAETSALLDDIDAALHAERAALPGRQMALDLQAAEAYQRTCAGLAYMDHGDIDRDVDAKRQAVEAYLFAHGASRPIADFMRQRDWFRVHPPTEGGHPGIVDALTEHDLGDGYAAYIARVGLRYRVDRARDAAARLK